MKAGARAAATTIYSLLAVLAFGVLAVLLVPPPTPSWSLIASTPDAALLMGSLLALGLVSAALAFVLWRRVQLPVIAVRALMLSLPVVAIGWNVVAPLFWVLPIFFAWHMENTA
jgi:hypothetical protein